MDLEDRIAEVEMNPLIVKAEGRGIAAVDALVVLEPLASGGRR